MTAIEKMRFCREGKLPSRVLRAALKDPLVPVDLYEAHCPCGENDPLWIQTARHLSTKKTSRPWFPKLYVKYGSGTYNEAMKALNAYRKVKAFHKTWLALRTATVEASLGLSQYGVEVVIELSESGWKTFLAQLSNEVVGHLKGKVESAIQDHAKSKMSTRAQLRFEKALAYLDRIQMLDMIWKGVKAKELAKKKHDDPEVFDYKLRFFIGLLAKGKGFLRLYKQYWAYDKIYWRLLDLAGREKALRAGQKQSSNSWKPASKRNSTVLLPADQGLTY